MKTAEILNAIPQNMSLEAYFDSLDVFEKRQLLNELEVTKENYSISLNRNTKLACFSYLVSFGCYFGVKETWFIFYLICLNIPLSFFLFLNYKNSYTYLKAIRILEKRLKNS
ncbi:MAG: hypothetical protein ACKO7D_04855 [Bacteroidota bacterium]